MMRRWPAFGLAVLAAFALAGCGESPLAPSEPSSGGTTATTRTPPPLVTIAADGSTDLMTAPVGEAEFDSLNLRVGVSRTVSATALMDGSLGGEVRAGRYHLKVPPGAFQGLATVSLTMPDSTVMMCDLTILPVALNKFQVPVVLTADLSAPGMTDASSCTNYWYDPLSVRWVSLVSKSRCSGTLVSTNLDHFSRYGSGKAGW